MDKTKLFIVIAAGLCMGGLLITNLSMSLYIIILLFFVMHFVMKQDVMLILFFLILFSSQIIDELQLPRLPLPIGTFIISDVIYIILLIIVARRILNDNGRKLHTPVMAPLLLVILSLVMASIITSIDSGQFIDLLYGLRKTLPYASLIFFIYTLSSVRDLDRLYSLFISVSLISSIFLILQYIGATDILGNIPFLNIEENPRHYLEYSRYIPAGFGIIVVAFIASLMKDHKKNRVLRLFVLAILGIPILLSFSNTFWMSIMLSIFIAFIVLDRRRLASKSLRASFLIIFLIVLIPALLQLSGKYSFGTLLSNIYGRTGHEYTDMSMEARITEARFAMKLVKEHPLLGSGLAPTFWNGQGFASGAHIAIVDIWLRLGLLGLLGIFWFIVRSLRRMSYIYKKIDDANCKSLISASFAIILCFTMASLLSNQFFYSVWPICLGFFIGSSERIWQLHSERQPVSNEFQNRVGSI